VVFDLNKLGGNTGHINTVNRQSNDATTYQRAHSQGNLICLPTGDGMVLVVLEDPI
jgi:hypothetical protein